MQSSSCTHILAENLSGSKTQKWIDSQAGRGGAKRTKVVSVDCTSFNSFPRIPYTPTSAPLLFRVDMGFKRTAANPVGDHG